MSTVQDEPRSCLVLLVGRILWRGLLTVHQTSLLLVDGRLRSNDNAVGAPSLATAPEQGSHAHDDAAEEHDETEVMLATRFSIRELG